MKSESVKRAAQDGIECESVHGGEEKKREDETYAELVVGQDEDLEVAQELDVVGQKAELIGAEIELDEVLPAGHVERQLLQRVHLQVQLREVPRARENACNSE